MYTKRIIGLLAMLLVLAPATLSAQTPDQQIERALQRARQAGVPVQLLESKIAEGKAKKIPLAIIARAVEQRLEVLQRVQTRLAERQLNSEELGVAADALLTGVSESALQNVAENAPRERRSVAISTLQSLVQLGHSSEQALESVTKALKGGPDALLNLPAQAAAARAAHGGGPPQGAGASSQGRGGPPAAVKPKPDRGRGGGG